LDWTSERKTAKALKPAPALGFRAFAVFAIGKFRARATLDARARRASRAMRFSGVVERQNGH
jgi:hypothetical protein